MDTDKERLTMRACAAIALLCFIIAAVAGALMKKWPQLFIAAGLAFWVFPAVAEWTT